MTNNNAKDLTHHKFTQQMLCIELALGFGKVFLLLLRNGAEAIEDKKIIKISSS